MWTAVQKYREVRKQSKIYAQRSDSMLKGLSINLTSFVHVLTIDQKEEETLHNQQEDKDKGIGSDLVFTFKEDVKKIGKI